VKQPKKYDLSVVEWPGARNDSGTLALSEANASLCGYWLMLRPWLRVVTTLTLVTAVAVFVLDKYVRTQWYQATAIIRPASREGPISPLAMMLGSTSLATSLGALTGGGGLGDEIADDVAKYMTLMKSYRFTVSLVERHKLQPMLYRRSEISRLTHPFAKLPASPEALHWIWYKGMLSRFSYHYDEPKGNLILHFMSPDRAEASQVLQYYIDDLRSRLRSRAVQEARGAVASLESALKETSDPLIEQQLAILAAQQIQQEKTAQAQADFAFTVLEPPFVAQAVYEPNALLHGLVALVLTPLFCFIAIVLYQRVYLPIREAVQVLSDARSTNDSEAPAVNGADGPSRGDFDDARQVKL
jgi:hypothetical protein